MGYEDLFIEFWKQVTESADNGHFAKLTMAKTVGKPNLRNIFLRPVHSDDGFRVLLKFRYRSTETEDIEENVTLEEAFTVVQEHLVKSFSSVLLFSTKKDVTFKVNKKGAASIIEGPASFKEVVLAKVE